MSMSLGEIEFKLQLLKEFKEMLAEEKRVVENNTVYDMATGRNRKATHAEILFQKAKIEFLEKEIQEIVDTKVDTIPF